MNPKARATREVDKDFLALIRALPCLVCGAPPQSDPHHLRSRGAHGSDRTVVPLCRIHHGEAHSLLAGEFFARYRVHLWNWSRAKQAEVFGETSETENIERRRVPALRPVRIVK